MTRSHSFSIHPTIRNKPPLWQAEFARDWQQRRGTLSDLANHIAAGGAFVAAAMTSDHRTSAAFQESSLAVVDIDSGLSLEEFKAHPLAAHAGLIYTSASHTEEANRFRVVFQLPTVIADADLYKAVVTLLIRAFGGDKSCSDACRIFYGNDKATVQLDPDAVLPESILDDAHQEAMQARLRYDKAKACYDEETLQRAIFVLEQVLEPTTDGQRDRFVRITAAAASGGDAVFHAWSDWATRGHHGSGKNSKQSTERFFRGFHGDSSLATLFFLASEDKPNWRDELPQELRGDSTYQMAAGFKVVGYDHEDFLGEIDYENERPRELTAAAALATPSLFDTERPWMNVIRPAAPAIKPRLTEDDDGDVDEEFLEDPYAEVNGDAPAAEPHAPEARRRRGGGKASEDDVEVIKNRLQRLYPGLRLNSMSLDLEHGPVERPQSVQDATTAYVRISRGASKVYPKTLVYDVAQIVAYENRYHPVRSYLERCSSTVEPCPYFGTLASELLGLPEDPLFTPTFEDGRKFADVIMERFLIGAVARVLEPGCTHDWMPILIGSQNCGKSNFFRYLTPAHPLSINNYPWVSTIQQGVSYLKDRPHILHAAWIVVLDEAERFFQRKYTEELKNLVSVSVDRSRRLYENERNFPRSFVLAGATNSTEFLVDPTGNRRFMPIPVVGKVPHPLSNSVKIIDLDRLQADRDAIWSAAYRAYLDQGTHCWDSYELSAMKEYLEFFTSDDPMFTKLQTILETRSSGIWKGMTYVTLSDVYQWLELPLTQMSQTKQAVTDVLKALGYRLKRARIGGKEIRMWVKTVKPKQLT